MRACEIINWTFARADFEPSQGARKKHTEGLRWTSNAGVGQYQLGKCLDCFHWPLSYKFITVP